MLHTHRFVLTCAWLAAAAMLPMSGCDSIRFSGERATPRVDNRELAANLSTQGRQAMEQGDTGAALALFLKALERDPNQLDAHLGIGDIHQIRGDYGRAAEQYAVAVQKSPTNFDANYKLGLMYHLLNRVREAISTYLAALSIDPDNFDANLNLATAYLQIRQPQLALPYAEKAVAINPESQAAYVNLGAVYSGVGRHQDAVNAYRSAADHGELSPPIALNLASALIQVESYTRAVNTLETMLRQDPRPEYYERLGYAHFKAGNFEQSMEAYERSLKLKPEDPAALNGLGVNLMTRYIQGERAQPALRDRAIDAWQRSVRLKSDQPRIIDLIARYRGI